MDENTAYDVAMIGGGLAGLSCAIVLAKQNFNVLLLEKEKYPFHKVCGEYISLESRDFLNSLGLNLESRSLPFVRHLLLSSCSGKHLMHPLPLGGIGISRFTIDHELARLAQISGATVVDGTKVNDVISEKDYFRIHTDQREFRSRSVCGAFGKRSNLDIRWKRSFTLNRPGALNNFIAVKYHALLDRRNDLIELHNFPGGYCGIAPVEDGKSCICYLTTAHHLKNNENNISKMEEKVLFTNPFLKKVFLEARMLYDKPLVISQISFEKKTQSEDGILFLGDAASMIAPLCGNGMSMALHSSRMAGTYLVKYLEGHISLKDAGALYASEWKRSFGRRLTAGRMIQKLFSREWMTNAAIGLCRNYPQLLTRIIRQTHG